MSDTPNVRFQFDLGDEAWSVGTDLPPERAVAGVGVMSKAIKVPHTGGQYWRIFFKEPFANTDYAAFFTVIDEYGAFDRNMYVYSVRHTHWIDFTPVGDTTTKRLTAMIFAE